MAKFIELAAFTSRAVTTCLLALINVTACLNASGSEIFPEPIVVPTIVSDLPNVIEDGAWKDKVQDNETCSAFVMNIGPMKAATSGWTGYMIVVQQPDNSTLVGRVASLGALASVVRGDRICTRLAGTELYVKVPTETTWTKIMFVRHDATPTLGN